MFEEDDEEETVLASNKSQVTLNDLQRELKTLRKRVDQNEDRLEQTTEKLDHLTEVVSEDRIQNIYSFADQSERQDFTSNLAKSNCILITGT